MPASEPVDFIPADFYIQIPHGDETGQRGYFVLRRKYHTCRADRIGKSKLLNFGKSFAQLKLSISIDLRV